MPREPRSGHQGKVVPSPESSSQIGQRIFLCFNIKCNMTSKEVQTCGLPPGQNTVDLHKTKLYVAFCISCPSIRYTCLKGFDLCQKEQCWLCSASPELFIRDSSCWTSVSLFETQFSPLAHLVLCCCCFALCPSLIHQIFTERLRRTAWGRPCEDYKGGEDTVPALKEL